MGILEKQKFREEEKKRLKKQLEEEKKNEKRKLKELKILKRSIDLSKDELQYLIKHIAHTKFEGLELQIIYNITAKLQNQLKALTKWDHGKK